MSIALALASVTGALFGLLFAYLQVYLVRRYAVGKPDHIVQRCYDTIDQLKLTSFIGLPILFAIVGYMTAIAWLQ